MSRHWRWIIDHPLSSVIMCVKGGLCNRRHSLWILFILLMLCIAIQTFVARQTRVSSRTDKLRELPHLKHTVNKLHLFSTLQNVQESLHPETSLATKQDLKSLQTNKLSNLQKGEYGKQFDDILVRHVDKIVNFVSRSHREERQSPTPLTYSKAHNSIHAKATCQPKSHIFFLKTHKTASSTILNILYRYGDSRNLTFALPLNKHSQFFYPFFFASYFVEGIRSRRVMEFHIMCNHMRFRKSEVAKVMPEDTYYFSILRHPVSMMESIFIYYKSIQAFQKIKSLDDFLKNSWRTYNSSVINNHYAHNILAFDFGLNNNIAADGEDLEDTAKMAIAAIEHDFHLILISEYFDESMILLKHALCWSLEDVVSFKINSRSELTRHPLTANTAEKIKEWNALDWMIYLHFNTTFWHKVNTLVGQAQLVREVSQLREQQVKLAKTCLKDGKAVDPSQIKDAGLRPFQYGAAVIQGYNLKPNINRQVRTKCQKLITPELQYTDCLYSKQFPELAVKHRQAARIDSSLNHCSDKTDMVRMNRAKTANQRQSMRHTS